MRLALVLCALLALLTPVRAGAASSLTAQIQATYESVRDFQADFTQELKNAASGETETRTGTIQYKSPNLVRWETVSPEKELLVLGSDFAWDYFADEGVVYKYRIGDVLSSKTMLRFISGKAKLDEDFIIGEEVQEKDSIRIRLTPKEPEPNLVSATVWVDPQTSLLTQVLIQDFYGNLNRLALKNLQLNPGLFPNQFRFSPPQGVQVLDNAK